MKRFLIPSAVFAVCGFVIGIAVVSDDGWPYVPLAAQMAISGYASLRYEIDRTPAGKFHEP